MVTMLRAGWVIILLFGVCASLSASAKTPLKVCHERADYAPYISYSDRKPVGILVDIIEATVGKKNVQLILYSKSWKGCRADVRRGRAQALFAMIYTEERARNFAFPPESKRNEWFLWQAEYPVFTHISEEFDPERYTPKYGTGAPLGYVATDVLRERGWLSPIQYNPAEGLNMLSLQKLDGYVVERLIGQYLIRRASLQKKVIAQDYVLLTSHWHLPFNKAFYRSNTSLVNRVWSNITDQRLNKTVN